MKRGALIPVFVFIFSCRQDHEMGNLKILKEIPVNPLLTEYSENNNPIYSFSYDSGRLVSHTQFAVDGNIEFNYEYDSSGKPNKIEVSRPSYNYTIYPEFSDSLLRELSIMADGRLQSRYVFENDSSGKMIKASRISPANVLIASAVFTWHGLNVTSYELKLLYVNPPITFRYDYEYDRLMNPYKVVFRDFKFNLIDFMPVSENNYIHMTGYNEDNPRSKVLISYQYSYSAGFPFFRYESLTDFNGATSNSYSDYNYVNQ